MSQLLLPYQRTIHHDGSPKYIRQVKGSPLQVGDEVVLRLRAHPDAPIERVFLRTTPDGEQDFTEMVRMPGDSVCDWWEIRASVNMPLFPYRFLIFTRDGHYWLNQRGLLSYNPADHEDFKLLAGYQPLRWVNHSVFYQIFPDRFFDGDSQNNVRDGEYIYRGANARTSRWDEPLPIQSAEDLVVFAGGDLEGIRQKLDYLEDLGVNALYLNPIFSALSNHRYDVIDYFSVDPHLGGDQALAELRIATRERGMRMILDVVPNHCGSSHPWFQQAQADPLCETAEYFTFEQHPQEYASWLGVQSLPKFNYQSRRLREVIYQADDSVFRHWLKPPFSMDGWRIDVANMLGRQGSSQLEYEIGNGIRSAVKETNPESYLLGENFFDASRQLQGEYLDATMNYSGFAKPVWYWLSRFNIWPRGFSNEVRSPIDWPGEDFAATLDSYRASIPWVIANQQFNLLGSHDTARISTVLKNNPAHIRLAAALLFTYPGVPSIYYGDEVGLQGDSKQNRETMPWDESRWDRSLRSYYQRLVDLRRNDPALIEGGFQWLLVEADTVAYLRDHEHSQIIVIAHRGPSDRPDGLLPVAHGAVPDGSQWEDFFSGNRYEVTGGALRLPATPTGAMILIRVYLIS